MGIDLGTSSLKVLIIDGEGRTKATGFRTYQFEVPHPGHAEQSTEIWWNACREAVGEALGRLGKNEASRVKAVGFSGQMHGLVMLDRHMRVLRPAILHCDARSGGEAMRLETLMAGSPPFNPAYTGFLLSSLLWVRDNEPELYRNIDRVCLPKDFLKLKLCGELGTDYSDASGTLAFDIKNMRWSEEILEKLDLPPQWFPPCSDVSHVMGTVSRQGAAETGLAGGTLVTSGGGDQIMQAIGNGAVRPGQATVNIGSSGQVCFQCDRPIPNEAHTTNTFCGYDRSSWITMGATMSAGLSLKWFNNLFSGGDFSRLDAEAGALPPGAGGLLFLPWLNGERTPHVNPDLSGAFLGLNLTTQRAHLARAVMEGVAFSLYQCLEICSNLGLRCEELIISGGGGQSALWRQILADVFGRPLKAAMPEEQACMGAALAAFTGAGIFKSLKEACSSLIVYQEELKYPDQKNHEKYKSLYRYYKEVYAPLGETLQKLTRLGRLS
jgi:xylulokinase